MKRVNLRSFRKTIEKYLEDSKMGGKLITFLEIDDSSDNMDVSDCMQENPVYTKAIHENLYFLLPVCSLPDLVKSYNPTRSSFRQKNEFLSLRVHISDMLHSYSYL